MKLVAGPWGDLSQDFLLLLMIFVGKSGESVARVSRVETGARKPAKVMGEVRRVM